MLAEQRRKSILVELERLESVSVAELSHRFGVSDMTIRRDLDALSEQELLRKVHGGAVRKNEKMGKEPHFAQKRSLQLAEKKGIAGEAVRLIDPGDTVAFGAGTTTWYVASALRQVNENGFTFITNSTNIALTLQENGWEQIVLSGGSFRTPSDALVGPYAERTLKSLNADTLFLGAHGVHPHTGLTTPNIAEAETDRILMEAARRVIIVADHTKLGVVALAQIASLSKTDILITDDKANEGILKEIELIGVRVIVAASG